MRMRLTPIAAGLLALALASGGAQAQSRAKRDAAQFFHEVLDYRWYQSQREQAGDSLALVCDRQNGLSSGIAQLADNCVMATLNDDGAGGVSRHGSAGASISRGGNKLGMAIGNGRDSLPAWLAPGQRAGKVESSDFSLLAEKNIGREAYVSVGGTVARARLVPAADVPQLVDQWNTRSLSIGGGFGAFGANIVGRVVNVPGESNVWKGLGLGLTWRTPWSGQLTLGADNVVTRGKNPFSTANQDDQGTIPYVRYKQDL